MPITTGGGAKLEVEQAPPLIVSSYVPGSTRPFRSNRFPVWRIPCVDDLSYYKGLQSVWDDPFVLVNVEHDCLVDDDIVQSLLDCKFKMCTVAHSLFWPSTHRPEPQYAQRHNPPANCKRENLYLGTPIERGQEWCDFTAIGCCKMHPEVRVGALAESHWSHVDISVTAACSGRWHVHWLADGREIHDHY